MQILGSPAKKTFKTKQRGIAVATGGTVTVTIASVKKANSLLKINYAFSSTTSTNAQSTTLSGKILNDTQIEFYCANTPNKVISWEVEEYNQVKSRQEGEISRSYITSEVAQAISDVNVDKALLEASHHCIVSVTGNAGSVLMRSRMINNTSFGILINPDSASQNDVIKWQVLELK